jgi:polyhydroxybutyrate depolymerase
MPTHPVINSETGIKGLGRAGLCLLIFSLAGCVASLPPSTELKGGTYRRYTGRWDFIHPRNYLIHLPRDFRPDRSYPLVIALHGSFVTAVEFEEHTGLSDLADREKFIVAYPNAIGLMGYFQHWNAGHCCAMAVRLGIDDVGFLDDVIDEIAARVRIQPHRVYMLGFSNGGMMVHRYAAMRAGRLAAAGVVAGAIGSYTKKESPRIDLRAPGEPVPMAVIHGTADRKLPYAGGAGEGDENGRRYLPVSSAVDFWRQNNGCTNETAKKPLADGRVTRQTWQGDAPGSRVVLYALHGWDHPWPGPSAAGRGEADATLDDFDAGRVLWNFFVQHTR